MKNNTKFKTADICDIHSDDLIIMHQQFNSYGKIDSFCGQINTIKCFNDNSKVREAVNLMVANKVLVLMVMRQQTALYLAICLQKLLLKIIGQELL